MTTCVPAATGGRGAPGLRAAQQGELLQPEVHV